MCISTAAGAAASDADEVARPRKPVPLGLFRPISLRPEAVELRIEPGHWEGDLIIGARNGSGVVALIDRVCHYCLLGDLPEGEDHPQEAETEGHPRQRRRASLILHYWAEYTEAAEYVFASVVIGYRDGSVQIACEAPQSVVPLIKDKQLLLHDRLKPTTRRVIEDRDDHDCTALIQGHLFNLIDCRASRGERTINTSS
jgi:hypothetical protein